MALERVLQRFDFRSALAWERVERRELRLDVQLRPTRHDSSTKNRERRRRDLCNECREAVGEVREMLRAAPAVGALCSAIVLTRRPEAIRLFR